MCPCQPNDSQFTVALLTTAGILLVVEILRRFWPSMTTVLRITVVAVGIVSLACAAFAFSRWGDRPDTCPAPPPAAAWQVSTFAEQIDTVNAERPPASAAGESVTTQPTAPRVIAYYFHRTMRCPSCLAIEELSKQAIETGFMSEMSGGLLAWRSINIEEKDNEHFENDFHLTAQSLVLVQMENGRPANWRNLEAVWDHLDDPAALQRYVQAELQLFFYADIASKP